MINTLSELEVLEIAKGIEETGYNFYKQAAEHFEDEEIKKIFEYLAFEELEHLKTFERIYDRVAEKIQDDKSYLYDDDAAVYLRAISETAIFHTKGLTGNNAQKVHCPKEALLIGLQAEKDSILFYEGVLANTQIEITKRVLQRLIKEEIKHLHEFRNLINELKE